MAWQLSLRQRLIRLILIASGLAMLLVIGGMLAYDLKTFRPATEKQLVEDAAVLSEMLQAPLEFLDKENARSYLVSLGKARNLELAVLLDARTNRFAEFRHDDDAAITAPRPAGAQFDVFSVSIWQVVRHGERVIGYLYLQEAIPPFYARVPQDFIMMVVVALVLIAMATVLLMGMQRYFLKPLFELVETSAQVTQNADYSVRVPIKNDDELGRLARGFNQMLETIGQRDAALLEATAQIQNVFNSATEVAIIATEIKGLVRLFNSGAERMLGYSAAEVIGRHTPELWHLREEIEARGRELSLSSGRTITGFDAFVEPARQAQHDVREWTFVRKDGTRLTVQLVVTTIRNREREITGFLGLASDLTERQRAEFAMRESELKFRTLFDKSNDAICMMDEHVFLSCNPQTLVMFGCQSADIMGHSPADFSPVAQPDGGLSRELAREKIDRAFAGQPQFFEWRHTRLDQTPFDTEVSLNRIELDGKVFLQAIIRDITNRKRAEIELQRREEYFRSLIEHASDSITVIDAQAVVTYQSASGERILGYPAAAFIGRCLLDLAHPEDRLRSQAAFHQSLAQLNVPITLTVRLRHQNGLWRHIEAVGTSIQTEAGEQQIIINSRDVSDSLQLEQQFRQAQKMEAVGRLAGGVAHDFNNILSALLMQSEMLLGVEPLPEEVRDGLREMVTDVNRAAALTRQLLMFSRRQVMQSQVLNLNELIMNLGKMLQRLIREDVQLQLNLHAAPLLTRADPGMLEQVLMNLAVNARDAMPKGGRLQVATTAVTVAEGSARVNAEVPPGRYVSLSVSDTGSGIPPEVLPQIFEPFFTTKEAGSGTWLGLATVFGIVKQHQGWIELDNRPGEGVTFQIFLPASRETSVGPAPTDVKPKPRGGTETIFLVEDELAVRKPTRIFLERQGYRVVEAANGMEALARWPEHRGRVALLLTDLVMPGGMNGQELARQLVAEQPQLKVIYVSGYSADIAGRDFQLRLGESFIQKPYATDHLLETIRRFLDV